MRGNIIRHGFFSHTIWQRRGRWKHLLTLWKMKWFEWEQRISINAQIFPSLWISYDWTATTECCSNVKKCTRKIGRQIVFYLMHLIYLMSCDNFFIFPFHPRDQQVWSPNTLLRSIIYFELSFYWLRYYNIFNNSRCL